MTVWTGADHGLREFALGKGITRLVDMQFVLFVLKLFELIFNRLSLAYKLRDFHLSPVSLDKCLFNSFEFEWFLQ
jgi:hypothetical protein